MDTSAFDSLSAELTELLIELAPVAEAIDLEPRLHQENEMAHVAEGWIKLHEGLSESTFRIQCLLRSGDEILEQFVVLVSELGVSTVFDRDGWVRLRHDPYVPLGVVAL
jgi:hypothetical protein